MSASTRARRTTVTDVSGTYVLANLAAATYEVSFQLPGFKTILARVQMSVGAAVTANATLELGGLTETVSVAVASERIGTRTPEVATTIDQRQVSTLPTLTRNPYDFIALAGNLSRDDQVPASRGAQGFAINGQRASSSNVLLDGAANNDEFTASVGEAVPLGAVQEFSVISSNFSAQYGRATGGIVNLITRSGSNEFHGSADYFFRNELMMTPTVDQVWAAFTSRCRGICRYSPGSAIPFGGPQTLLQFHHDQTLLKGRHDLRFGGSYARIMDDRTFGAYQESVMTLGSNVSDGMENLMRGQLHQFEGAVDPRGGFPGQTITLPVQAPDFTRHNRYNDYALYANDGWRASHSVTVSLGVRYEYYGVQHNTDPALDSNFYYGPGTSLPAQVRSGAVLKAPDSPVGGLWKPDTNNLAPRLGFAWDVHGNGRMSVRGGYGMAYERNFGNVTFNVIQNPPSYAVVALVAGTDVPTIPISTDNAGPLAGVGSTVLPQVSLRHVDQNITNAYAHFWSASGSSPSHHCPRQKSCRRVIPTRTSTSISTASRRA